MQKKTNTKIEEKKTRFKLSRRSYNLPKPKNDSIEAFTQNIF